MITVFEHGAKFIVYCPVTSEGTTMINVRFVEIGRGGVSKRSVHTHPVRAHADLYSAASEST